MANIYTHGGRGFLQHIRFFIETNHSGIRIKFGYLLNPFSFNLSLFFIFTNRIILDLIILFYFLKYTIIQLYYVKSIYIFLASMFLFAWQWQWVKMYVN